MNNHIEEKKRYLIEFIEKNRGKHILFVGDYNEITALKQLDLNISFIMYDNIINYKDKIDAIILSDYNHNLQYKEDLNTLYVNNPAVKLYKLTMRKKEKKLFFAESKLSSWYRYYNLAKIYCEHYKTDTIPQHFKTSNGIDYDESGSALGIWFTTQKQRIKKGNIEGYRVELLNQLGLSLKIEHRSKWEDYYTLAKSYYEKYSNLDIPESYKTSNGIDYDENGVSLGKWISLQRRKYNIGELSKDHKILLDKIGIDFTPYKEKKWYNYYKEAKSYYLKNHNLRLPYHYTTGDGKDLREWLKKQIKAYENGGLPKDKEELLRQIGLNFDNEDIFISEWDKMYQLAVEYFRHYNNLDVPHSFKTNDGFNYDENGKKLGVWVTNQRQNFHNNKLSISGITKLIKIGMVFTGRTKNEKWQQIYDLIKKYYEYYHTLEQPSDFRTKDGITYDKDGSNIQRWLSNQKRLEKLGLLSDERKNKLLELDSTLFENNRAIIDWEHGYQICLAYYNCYGNLDVPTDFKTKDGVTYNSFGISLYYWISNQKHNYSKLTSRQMELLNAIGFSSFIISHDDRWNKYFELLSNYYKHYGDLKVPMDFKTKDGINYDNEGLNLYSWFKRQKEYIATGKLSEERSNKLVNLEPNLLASVTFEDYNSSWNRLYNLAKTYYETNGNLHIPSLYKTKDGISYNMDGEKLGAWIAKQRNLYKDGLLSDDRIELLNKIMMIWSIKTNKESIKEKCEQYNIDEQKNKSILKHITYQEFIAKIFYLEEISLPITDETGKLNVIFQMCSSEIEKTFGITTEEIINSYNIKVKEKRL